MSTSIPVRRVRFQWPDDLRPIWAPRQPELAIAANAVSLLMPHVEPYVVATVRTQVAELRSSSPELAADTEAYVTQEAQHHAQHRRFNDLMGRHYPALSRVERQMAWVFAKLRRRSTRFGLAFAAGFECIAFIAARWVDRRQSLLRDADPTAVTLFLWHLAEEVEHKEVAWDVYEASGGGRLRYAWATWVAGFVLAWFSLVGAWVMLWKEGRFWRPGSHLRLVGWSLSFIFTAVPAMVVSALPGHHPRDLANPIGLEHWLENLDPETSTVPEWSLP